MSYYHHHVAIIELGPLLTRSSLTYPESLQWSLLVFSAFWYVVFFYGLNMQPGILEG